MGWGQGSAANSRALSVKGGSRNQSVKVLEEERTDRAVGRRPAWGVSPGTESGRQVGGQHGHRVGSCKKHTERSPLISNVGSMVTLANSWAFYCPPSGFTRVVLQLRTVPETQRQRLLISASLPAGFPQFTWAAGRYNLEMPLG